MRTRTLRVTAGAYSDGTWHASLVTDEYERGVLVNSTLEAISHGLTPHQLRWNVRLYIDRLIAIEEERLETASGGADQDTSAPARATG